MNAATRRSPNSPGPSANAPWDSLKRSAALTRARHRSRALARGSAVASGAGAVARRSSLVCLRAFALRARPVPELDRPPKRSSAGGISIDWPAVRKELDAIGYNGWMTIEGSGGLSLEERSNRLDLIAAGK